MDASRMRDIFKPHLSQIREHVFLNSELGMIRGDQTVFSLLMRQRPPFTINDHRFGIIMSGEAEINFNLQRHIGLCRPGHHHPSQASVARSPYLRHGTFSQLPHALCAGTDAIGLQRSGTRLPVTRQRSGYRYCSTYSGHYLANGSYHQRLSSSHHHSPCSSPDAPLRPSVSSAGRPIGQQPFA